MSVTVAEDFRGVEDFLRRWHALPAKRRHRIAHEVPIDQMQVAALHHHNPWIRKSCLHFLDHYASDQSVATFLGALDDPVVPVRELALHGLACEQCRSAELCVSEVVPVLAGVLGSDPSPEVRQRTIPILLRLSGRDPRARLAIEDASTKDEDRLVRQVAEASLQGDERQALRSRHDLQRRARSRRGKSRVWATKAAGP